MRKHLPKLIALIIIAGVILVILKATHSSPKNIMARFKAQPTPPPPPIIMEVNGKTLVKYPQDFTLVLLGDSMTERLGNSDEIREGIVKNYPGKTVEVLNYGFGSTNITSALDRLTTETEHHGRKFQPILNIDFQLILIESFGHNPLSQYSLEEGLKIQTETLDKIVKTITDEGRGDKIVFVGTIAPNTKTYAQNTVELTSEKRAEWAKERMAYIQNHLQYAKSHNIPVIDIYSASLDNNGDGKTVYIDSVDNIHPSPSGIVFISNQIAKSIADLQLLKSKN